MLKEKGIETLDKMGLDVLMVWLGTKMDHTLLTVIAIGIAGLLAGVCYKIAIRLR